MITRGLFVTGTDTDAGKTHVTCGLIDLLKRSGRTVQPFKPLCTGVDDDNRADIGRLATAAGVSQASVAGLSFSTPVSPPSAARAEDAVVDVTALEARYYELVAKQPDLVVVEGAGGILCPVNDELVMVDLAIRWKLPLLIVSGLKLGAINHTLLTIEAARQRGLAASVVLAEPCSLDPVVLTSTVGELYDRLGGQIVAVMPNGRPLLKIDSDPPSMNSDGPLWSAEDALGLFQPLE